MRAEDGDEQDPWGSCHCYDRLAYFLTILCRCSSCRSGPFRVTIVSIRTIQTTTRILSKFEFPVLLVLLYVRVASLFYIKRVGPDQI
jgi:hypothetical protein